MESGPLELVDPDLDRLPGYVAALEAGWSPNTTRDVSAEQLAAIARNSADFILGLTEHEGRTVTATDGTQVPRLPGRVFWLWDGAFCGVINFRYVPGTLDLPVYVSGHVGYAVVPWKRRRGYATRALAALLPLARESGLARLLVTCDVDNAASRRVIEANGGRFEGCEPGSDGGAGRLLFWVDVPREGEGKGG